uniref:Major facilitator superfamily (MFS) profile domain-containing protein n=1 Tax=Chromera velia CCMP2878 TaxID=1169474 RepID=A0A0G4I4K6_9ALVE|eukprot:Cvel_10931.t1-p1 / transcript=Cvel_10931.t1 / gene=Cvel_10931 / organism=Chromera_velia_CCMP2878 / gene_product=Tetracycline resistance protein, class H, putative / transcript_product=Tetracycline resistance protein, class H, putative / location=Cvel_scaffold672:31953-35835(+) / protein_length=585 / sequence_SO=supercontig / SO=protein_coding / is_pseudo=false
MRHMQMPEWISKEAEASNSCSFIIVISCLAFMLAGVGTAIPVLPYFAILEVGGSPFLLGLMFSVNSLAESIGALIWGRLSDSLGRRPFAVLVYFVCATGWFFAGFVTAMWQLILVRAFAGIVGGPSWIHFAMTVDLSNSRNVAKRLGYCGACIGVALVIGPCLGAALMSLLKVRRLCFFFAAAIAFCAAVFGHAFLPETLDRELRRPLPCVKEDEDEGEEGGDTIVFKEGGLQGEGKGEGEEGGTGSSPFAFFKAESSSNRRSGGDPVAEEGDREREALLSKRNNSLSSQQGGRRRDSNPFPPPFQDALVGGVSAASVSRRGSASAASSSSSAPPVRDRGSSGTPKQLSAEVQRILDDNAKIDSARERGAEGEGGMDRGYCVRGFVASMFAKFFSALAFAVAQATWPLLLKDRFGFEDVQLGLILAVAGVIGAVSQAFLFGFLERRLGRHLTVGTSVFFMGSSTLVIPKTAETSLALHLLAAGIFAVGFACASPGFHALGVYYCDRSHQGWAQGSLVSARNAALVFGPTFFGWLYTKSQSAPYYTAAGACGLSLCALALAAVVGERYEENEKGSPEGKMLGGEVA